MTATNQGMHTHRSTPAPARSVRGLRKTTPGSIRASRDARAYHEKNAPRPGKAATLKMFKMAAPMLGIDMMKVAIIDQLFAYSKPGDWEHHDGIGPRVWPSNAQIARRMGRPESTVRYHLAKLTEAGLIAWCDGPTCRRHGKRNQDGHIIEGFGIELSPLAMRHDEFAALVAADDETVREIKRIRNRCSTLDKEIRSLVDSALRLDLDAVTDGAFSQGIARRDLLCERRPAELEVWHHHVADYEDLYDRLEALYVKACAPSQPVSDLSRSWHRGANGLAAHTTTASTPNSESCNESGIAHDRRVNPTNTGDTLSNEAACGSMAYENKPRGNTAEHKQSPVDNAASGAFPEGQPTVATPATEPTERPQGMPGANSMGPQDLRDDTAGPNAASGNAEHDGKHRPDTAGPHTVNDTAPTVAIADAGAVDHDVLQLSIGLVREACPAIETLAPGALSHWQHLRDSAYALCAGTDINTQVFDEAATHLGPDIAIAATAVTVQKAANGDVFNPGAYLRTLTKRGRAGKLNIAKSLHGLASRNSQDRKEDPMNDNTSYDGSGQQTAQIAPGYNSNAQEPGAKAAPRDQAQNQARTDAITQHHGTGTRQGGQDSARSAPASALQPSRPFPGGSIAYTPWADIVRQNAPEPIPDVDRVADAFRGFCRRHAIDTSSPNIKTVFSTFSRKWQNNNENRDATGRAATA